MRCSLPFILLITLALCVRAQGQEVVARVNGEEITDRDVAAFGERSPRLSSYLSMPGGPMRILRLMIDDRLLLLEGERLHIPRPRGGGDQMYLMKLQAEMVKPCPAPDEQTVAQFFSDHIDRYSTPLLIRLRRIGLPIGNDNGEQATARLLQIKSTLESGAGDFAAIANEVSEDHIGRGRGGDIGFTPIEVRDNPLLEVFTSEPSERILGPLFERDMVFIYQVTGRREPIAESLSVVRDQVVKDYARICRKQRLERLTEELKTRWPVEVLVDDISTRPERRSKPLVDSGTNSAAQP